MHMLDCKQANPWIFVGLCLTVVFLNHEWRVVFESRRGTDSSPEKNIESNRNQY